MRIIPCPPPGRTVDFRHWFRKVLAVQTASGIRLRRVMDDTQHHARTVFIAAIALDTPEARARHLDEACRGRPELRQRVEELLRAHDQTHSLFELSGGCGAAK